MDGVNGTGAQVRAGGGVVWRRAPGAGTGNGPQVPAIEVLLVHRPKYDDWSFPKGKTEPGEDDREGAVREVAEETGLEAVPGSELTPVHYTDHKGRPKRVRYWLMEVRGGDGRLTHETDETRWLPATEAGRLLTYDLDRAVLDEAVNVLNRTGSGEGEPS